MRYAVYGPNGQISKVVVTTPEDIILELKEGDQFIELPEGDDSTFYVSANATLVPIPPAPSRHHIFNFDTKQWTDTRTTESEWFLVRDERKRRLAASDWTQLPDVPLATKEAWAVYRQALRDITTQPDPFNITWPIPPTT